VRAAFIPHLSLSANKQQWAKERDVKKKEVTGEEMWKMIAKGKTASVTVVSLRNGEVFFFTFE
jgi:hypothetical protein